MSNPHIENATSWLNATIVDVHDSTPAGQRLRAELAQAHATLAVAHELRTANLIAYQAMWHQIQQSEPTEASDNDIAARLDLRETK